MVITYRSSYTLFSRANIISFSKTIFVFFFTLIIVGIFLKFLNQNNYKLGILISKLQVQGQFSFTCTPRITIALHNVRINVLFPARNKIRVQKTFPDTYYRSDSFLM